MLRHKALIVEPRDAASFGAAIAQYNAKLNEPGSGGAMLLAVCRGKVCVGGGIWDGVCVGGGGRLYLYQSPPRSQTHSHIDEQMSR